MARLGFNAKLLIEMGEEVGSPGLRRICESRAMSLRADVLIASDGPRLRSDRPTIFLGSRGAFNFDLGVELREGAHHSGNWGGLLANPGIVLANAIASMVDARGRILVAGLQPPPISQSVRRALADIEPGEPDGPAIDANWGEPGLTPAERVFGWNALEVLAFRTGNPDRVPSGCAEVRWRRPAIRRLDHAAGESGRRWAMARSTRHRGLGGASIGTTGASGDPAEPWRLAAERLLRRCARSTDDLGAAFLSRVLAARSRRALAGPCRARGARDHDGTVLGPRGARQRAGRRADRRADRRRRVTAAGGAVFATIGVRAGVAQW